MAIDRLSSVDLGYAPGDLSLYPQALDDKDQLYVAANNAVTATSQSSSFNAQYFVVEDTAPFPSSGLIRVGTELVYYQTKSANTFRDLKRAYAGSRQGQWPIGTRVSAAVEAEPHNATKDAILNIERNLGVAAEPDPDSLNGILKALEVRFLAPRPLFKAAPKVGTPPLTVTFQNFSTGDALRYLWDFGDGATSQDAAPTHTYLGSGLYTVKLNMITSSGAQGIVTKTDYVNVSPDNGPAFFYFTPEVGPLSTEFSFVDQTDGEVVSRYWVFGDGETLATEDPDEHVVTHTYAAKGSYRPAVLVVFADGGKKMLRSEEEVLVA